MSKPPSWPNLGLHPSEWAALRARRRRHAAVLFDPADTLSRFPNYDRYQEALARGARLLRELRQMQPGECYRVDRHHLGDIQVPADPLDRQTIPYLVEWFRSRVPFECTAVEIVGNGAFEFRREPGISAVSVKGMSLEATKRAYFFHGSFMMIVNGDGETTILDRQRIEEA